MKYVLLLFLPAIVFATGVGELDNTERELVDVSVTTLKGPSGVLFLPLLDGVKETAVARISTEAVGAPDVMVSRLVSGETQIGVLPTNVVSQLYARGVPVINAGAFLWGVMYVVSNDGSIDSWEDLRGRTVYSLARGSTPDVLLRYILAENGVDPDTDVTIDYRYGHVELAQMVMTGAVETAVLPEPFVTRVTAGAHGVVLDFQEEYARLTGETYPQTSLVVRRDFAQAHPEAVASTVEAVRASMERVIDDPAAATELPALGEVGLPAPVIVAAFPRFNARFVPASAAQSEIDEYLQVLYNFDPATVGGSMPDDAFYYR